jgi:hypothetical protein
MTISAFEWRNEDGTQTEHVVVRHQPAIAVYLNPHDQVVIRQEGHYDPDEDQWIYIAPDNVPKVAQAILEAAGYETATTCGRPLLPPKPEPLTGAQRQKRYRDKHRDGDGDATVTDRDGNGDADRDSVTKLPFLAAAE